MVELSILSSYISIPSGIHKTFSASLLHTLIMESFLYVAVSVVNDNSHNTISNQRNDNKKKKNEPYLEKFSNNLTAGSGYIFIFVYIKGKIVLIYIYI